MTRQKLQSLFLSVMLVMSVFAGSLALTGLAAAGNNAGNDHTYDKELTQGTDNGLYWNGQSLLYNGTADATVQLYKENSGSSDTFVSELGTGAGGHVVIDTADLEGDYYIDDGGTTTSFNVAQQSLSADFASDSVSNGQTANTVEFHGDSNRAKFNLTVSAEGLDDSALSSIFANYGGTTTVDVENNTLTLVDYTNAAENEFNLDFQGIDKGDYTFQFDVADAASSDTASISVTEASSANGEFSASLYEEERGDVAAYTVNVDNTDTATIDVGSDDVNYNAEMTVTDKDGDGSVTVFVNTFEAGDGDATFADAYFTDADSDDTVTVNNEADIQVDALESAAYDLSLHVNGDETDVAALILNERGHQGASTHTAPKATSLSNLEDLSAVTQDNTIALEDKAVFKFDSTGLSGFLDDDSVTAADLKKGSAYSQNFGAYVEIKQTGNIVNNQPNMVDPSNGQLITDAQNDSFYLVFDTSATSVAADENYDATFVLNETNPYVDDTSSDVETEEVSTDVQFVERNLDFDNVAEDENGDDLIVYEADKNNTIVVSGDTTVAANTQINLRLRATGESPFLKSDTVAVAEDGTLSAEFDMTNVKDNTEFTTKAQSLSDAIDSRLTSAPAEVSASDVQATGEASTVVVDEVYLPNGGFVTIHDGTVQDGAVFDSVRGTSAYLEAGTHQNVEVSLDSPFMEDGTAVAMPHMDSDADETYDFVTSDGADDGPYTADGSAVVDTAAVDVVSASVSISDQTSNGATVTVDSVTLSEGGFVTIHDGSLLDGAVFDSVRGTSAYLEAGTHQDVEVILDEPYTEDGTVVAMPHLDSNDNQAYDFASDSDADGPYTSADGSAVVADATLTVDAGDEPTPTPEEPDEPTPTPNEPDEPTPTPNEPEEPSATPTENSTPGFGIVLVLVALAGAALVAHRRN